MELSTVDRVRQAFYRLVGTDSDDTELQARGEAAGEVAYVYLTRGCWAAQRWMLDVGYSGWRKRSASALAWTGADATDGGRYTALPTDCLKVYGSERRSALVEADGTRWGAQITDEDDYLRGNLYYVRGEDLWLARGAEPPATVYLDYHYRHPAWDDDLGDEAIDFPVEARPLIAAEAANFAKEDEWLPLGQEMELKIARALRAAQMQAQGIARATKAPRRMRAKRRYGNHW